VLYILHYVFTTIHFHFPSTVVSSQLSALPFCSWSDWRSTSDVVNGHVCRPYG